MREYQKRVHNPPTWDNREIIVVSGSQDGLSKALEAIIAPGDPILVQDPVYPGVTIVLLIVAAKDGNLEVALLALERGANVNASYHGSTALTFAVSRGQSKVVELLLDYQ
ncbi:hypothetical protein HCN44_001403 [Aphidius gifuensis]|uniref:Aminotransferase class I/classII domain-containing protein n=1 Tax=Aphidius gifuensis TaxID=684658 RepID=A0A834XTB3_APHGI|nr:hypothetical protein HCN44_001403 [Aphidius gifuensis]